MEHMNNARGAAGTMGNTSTRGQMAKNAAAQREAKRMAQDGQPEAGVSSPVGASIANSGITPSDTIKGKDNFDPNHSHEKSDKESPPPPSLDLKKY